MFVDETVVDEAPGEIAVEPLAVDALFNDAFGFRATQIAPSGKLPLEKLPLSASIAPALLPSKRNRWACAELAHSANVKPAQTANRQRREQFTKYLTCQMGNSNAANYGRKDK
jgi:hypothetical protein